MNRYDRRLPHWDAVNQPVFVTFRLAGSLPANRVFPPGKLTSGEAFVTMDRILDQAVTGPRYLAMPQIGSMMMQCIIDGDERFQRYTLHAFVVMSNHVHLLVTSRVPSGHWLQSLKGYSAYKANLILNRSGTFWQDESYDHLVRDGGFDRVKHYIEWNPVKAGLVTEPSLYRWSSAAPRGSAAAG